MYGILFDMGHRASAEKKTPFWFSWELRGARGPSTPREMRFALFLAPLRMTTLEWAAFDDSTRAGRDRLE